METTGRQVARTRKAFRHSILVIIVICTLILVIVQVTGWKTGRIIILLLFGYFLLLSIYRLCMTFVRYEWDADAITRQSPLGQSRMPWSEIADYRVFHGGDLIYQLIGADQRTLKVNVQHVGIGSPLHMAIEDKIQPLRERKLNALLDQPEISFPEQGVFGRETGAILTLTPDAIKRHTRLKVEALSYKQVLLVFIGDNNFTEKPVSVLNGEQIDSSYLTFTLNDGKRDRMRIATNFRDFDLLIDLLQRRLAAAHWVDMTQQPPEDRNIREWYFYHRLKAIKRRMWTRGWSTIFGLFIVYGLWRLWAIPESTFGFLFFISLIQGIPQLSERRKECLRVIAEMKKSGRDRS